jgi:hypothetical protein
VPSSSHSIVPTCEHRRDSETQAWPDRSLWGLCCSLRQNTNWQPHWQLCNRTLSYLYTPGLSGSPNRVAQNSMGRGNHTQVSISTSTHTCKVIFLTPVLWDHAPPTLCQDHEAPMGTPLGSIWPAVQSRLGKNRRCSLPAP